MKNAKKLLESFLPAAESKKEQREFLRQVIEHADAECKEMAKRDPLARIPLA